MIDAINGLSVLQFVLFVLATLTGLIQFFLLIGMVLRGGAITLLWGFASTALWITLFVVTR